MRLVHCAGHDCSGNVTSASTSGNHVATSNIDRIDARYPPIAFYRRVAVDLSAP